MSSTRWTAVNRAWSMPYLLVRRNKAPDRKRLLQHRTTRTYERPIHDQAVTPGGRGPKVRGQDHEQRCSDLSLGREARWRRSEPAPARQHGEWCCAISSKAVTSGQASIWDAAPRAVRPEPVKTQQLSVSDRLDGGRTQSAVKKRHLSDDIAGADLRDHHIAAVATPDSYCKTASDDDVECIREVVLAKQYFAARHANSHNLGF